MTQKRHISDLKPYFERKILKNFPISIRKAQFDVEPSVPIARQLRARKNVDYRELAGFRTRVTKN